MQQIYKTTNIYLNLRIKKLMMKKLMVINQLSQPLSNLKHQLYYKILIKVIYIG